MKKAILIITIGIISIVNTYSQSGTIYFFDGNNVKFQDVIKTENAEPGGQNTHQDLFVIYKGNPTLVPWSKISSFEITSVGAWKKFKGWKVNVIIATKTGIRVSHVLYFNLIGVSQYNPLTGGISKEYYQAVRNNRQNIEKIIMD